MARKADASADEIKTPMVAMDSPPMAPGSLYKLCSSPSPHGSDVTSLEVAKAPSPVPLPRSLSFGTEPGGGVVPGSPVFKMFVQNHFLKNGVIWYNIVLEAGAEPIPVKYKHNYKTSSAIIEYNEKNLQQPSGVTTAPSKEKKKPPVKRMLGFTIEGGVLTQKTIPISSDSWRYEPLEFENGVSAGTGVPEVAAPGVPEKPASGSPVVPAPCIPEVPATGVPEVPAPGVPEASASGVPEAPAPGVPVVQVVAESKRPKRARSALPEVEEDVSEQPPQKKQRGSSIRLGLKEKVMKGIVKGQGGKEAVDITSDKKRKRSATPPPPSSLKTKAEGFFNFVYEYYYLCSPSPPRFFYKPA
jgi:hypothetical protein